MSSTQSTSSLSNRLITVEPVVFIVLAIQGVLINLRTQYIEYRLAEQRNYTIPNVGAANSTCWVNETNSTTSEIQKEIEAETAVWLLYMKDISVFIPIVTDWGSTQQFCHKSMLKFHHLTTSSKTNDTADVAIGKEDMENGIKSKMAELLCMPMDAIDVTQPMINYGVDSLVALEMVNWATNQLKVTISQLDILGGITTADLLQKALGE